MIKAVIFDFGGVVHAIEKKDIKGMIADLYGVSGDDVKEKLNEYAFEMSKGKLTEKEFWDLLSKSLNKEVPDGWEKIWHERTTEGFSVNKRILELARELNVKNIQTLVLSNTIPPHAEFIRVQGWYAPFGKVYLSHEIGFRKPDIGAFKWLLNDQGLKGKECVYVDDLEENLRPARKLGMRTVLAVSPDQVVEDVNRLIL